MGTKFNVHVALNSRDYQTGADGVARSSKAAEGASASLGRTLKTLSAIVGSVGLAALGAQILRLATDFDTAFVRINTLVGINQQTLLEWRDTILRLGPEVGRGAGELSQALLVVTGAGAEGSQAMEILERSAKAATIGLGATGDVARAVTAAITAYGAENLDAATAVDQLIAVVKEGNLEATELAGVMGRVLGPAAQLGVSFSEAGAFVASFSRLGVNASEAVTGLSSVLANLIKPGEDARKALKEAGTSVEELKRSIREKGLAQALVDLVKLLGGNEEALGRIIPDVQGLAGVLGTAGRQGASYVQIARDIAAAHGQLTDSALAVTKASPAQAILDMKAAGESAATVIGQGLTEAMADAARTVADFLNSNREAFREFGQQLGALASTLLGSVLTAVKSLALAIDILTAAAVGFGVAWLALRIGQGVVWLWGLVKAATAAAVAENLLTAATLALSAAWQRLTAAMASNPIGLIAIALGLLAGILTLVALRSRDAAKSSEDYHQRLREGRSLVDDATSAHDRLVVSLERETAARERLNRQVATAKGRLAELEPVLENMRTALQGGDEAGYQKAVEDAERLGVSFAALGRSSAFEALTGQVKQLRAEINSATTGLEANGARIGSLQSEMRDRLGEVVKGEIELRLERRASLAELQLQLAQAEERYAALQARAAGDDLIGRMAQNASDRMKDLKRLIEETTTGLTAIDARIADMQNGIRDQARELFSRGQYEQGEQLATGAGIPAEEIAAAVAEWRAYNDALAEQRRKQAEAAEAAKRRMEVLDEEAKKYRDVKADLDAQIADQKRLVAAYRDGIESGRAAAAALEVEKKGREAAKSVAQSYRAEIRRVAEELAQWERDSAAAADIEEAAAETVQQLAAARAELADKIAGNTIATQAAARAAEVEAFRVKNALRAEDQRVKTRRASLETRDRELRQIILLGVQEQRNLEFSNALRTARAALADIANRSTEASRELAVQMEIENRVKADGVAGDAKKIFAIAAEVRGRRVLIDAITDEGSALQDLAQHHRDMAEAQARFADTQEARAARKALGSDVAAILEKYGLLSSATKQLALEERARAIFAKEHGTRTLGAVRAELEARQAEIDAAARANAGIEIAQLKSDQLYDSLAATFRGLSEILGGTGTLIGGLAAAFGDVIGSLARVRDAGKAWSAEWSSAMVGALASVSNLLKALDVGASNKSGGPQALGGRLDGNYAAEGSIVGMVVGAIIGYFAGGNVAAGAQIGAALGGVLGAMITKAGDSASANLLEGGIVQFDETSRQLNGAVMDALGNIFEGLNTELARLGLQLEDTPFINIKVRDNVIRVIVGNVVRTFSSMQDAVSFGIAEALKQAATSNNHLPAEIRKALQNSTATDLQSLQSDIDFARAIANYGVPEVVQSIDKAVSEFFVSMQRAAGLGIDTTKVVARFAEEIRDQKDKILGIDRAKSPEDQLRSDAEAFNRRMEILRAEKLADLAELEFKKAQLSAQVAIFRGEAEIAIGRTELDKTRLEVAQATIAAEAETLGAMVTALAAVETAIATTRGIIDSIVTISDKELQEALGRLRRQGRGNGRNLGAERDDFLRELDVIARGALPDSVQAVLALGDQLAEMTAKAKELKLTEDQLRAARQALIDQQKEQTVLDPVREFLEPQDGGTYGLNDWENQQAAIDKTFEDARAANQEILRLTGQRTIADWKLVAAQKRALAALSEEAIDSLGNPMEQTRDRVRALGETIEFLRKQAEDGIISGERYGQAMAETRLQAEGELFSLAQTILDRMGASEESEEFRRQLEEATFLLEVAQLNYLYEQYVALGLVSDAAAGKIRAALDYINDPANYPDFSAGGGGGGGGQPLYELPDSEAYYEDLRQVQESIAAQIREWSAVDLGPAASAAAELRDRFADLVAQANRYRLATGQLTAAYQQAVRGFVNEALEPFRHLGESETEARLREINNQFADLLTAFETIGASASDMAALEAARLAALQNFWQDATSGLRDLQESLLLSDQSPLTAGERFNLAQANFQQALAALQAGDLSQIERLPALIQQYLTEAQDSLPVGSEAYRAIFDQIQGVITQIMATGGTEGADPAALQALLDSLGLGNLGPQTPASGGGAGAPANNTPEQALLNANQVNADALIAEVRGLRADNNDYLRSIRQNTAVTAEETAGVRARLDRPLIASIR